MEPLKNNVPTGAGIILAFFVIFCLSLIKASM